MIKVTFNEEATGRVWHKFIPAQLSIQKGMVVKLEESSTHIVGEIIVDLTDPLVPKITCIV